MVHLRADYRRDPRNRRRAARLHQHDIDRPSGQRDPRGDRSCADGCGAHRRDAETRDGSIYSATTDAPEAPPVVNWRVGPTILTAPAGSSIGMTYAAMAEVLPGVVHVVVGWSRPTARAGCTGVGSPRSQPERRSPRGFTPGASSWAGSAVGPATLDHRHGRNAPGDSHPPPVAVRSAIDETACRKNPRFSGRPGRREWCRRRR